MGVTDGPLLCRIVGERVDLTGPAAAHSRQRLGCSYGDYRVDMMGALVESTSFLTRDQLATESCAVAAGCKSLENHVAPLFDVLPAPSAQRPISVSSCCRRCVGRPAGAVCGAAC